jgi:hypothetical protein
VALQPGDVFPTGGATIPAYVRTMRTAIVVISCLLALALADYFLAHSRYHHRLTPG